jgi:hypothetical protein
VKFFGDVDVIWVTSADSDIKVLFMKNGDIANFRLEQLLRRATACCSVPWLTSSGLCCHRVRRHRLAPVLMPVQLWLRHVFLDTDRVNFRRLLQGRAARWPRAGVL